MHREQLEMLKQLQALNFVALDFHLYLDTHPLDQRAFMEYQNTVNQLENLRQEYVRCYGPFNVKESSFGQSGWRWIEEPWPWEIEY